jgi:adenylate cyclase class 2
LGVAGRDKAKHEIEVKLRVSDIETLAAGLRQIGARSLGRVFERNTLYDTRQSHFRKGGCLLRVRTETPSPSRLFHGGRRSAVIAWKAPALAISERVASRYKVKLEREVSLKSPARSPGMLRAIGLHASFAYEKYRTTHRLGALRLDLDETPVGIFLELEGAPREIDRAARRLGFGPRDYLRCTYWDLYAAECRRQGITPQNMVF